MGLVWYEQLSPSFSCRFPLGVPPFSGSLSAPLLLTLFGLFSPEQILARLYFGYSEASVPLAGRPVYWCLCVRPFGGLFCSADYLVFILFPRRKVSAGSEFFPHRF